MVKFLDVTRPLSENAVVYTGDTRPGFCQRDQGLYLISVIHLSSHSGTHIDAPVHYLKQGMTVDEIPPSALIGGCRVIDLSSLDGEISPDPIEEFLDGAGRILLKTRFSAKNRFESEYPCLSPEAADMLVSRNIQCVGIDSPSIEKFNCDGSVHRTLLKSGCIIIELLDLSGISPGDYTMIALPLRLKGLDGSPARVILCREEGS